MTLFRAAIESDKTQVKLGYKLNSRVKQREVLIAHSLGLDESDELDMVDKLQQVLVYLSSHVKKPMVGVTSKQLQEIFKESSVTLLKKAENPKVPSHVSSAHLDTAILHEEISEEMDSLLSILVKTGDIIKISSSDISL